MKYVIFIISFLLHFHFINAQNSKFEIFGAIDQSALNSNDDTYLLILNPSPINKFNIGLNYIFKSKWKIKPMVGIRYTNLGFKTTIPIENQRWPDQVTNGVYDPTIPPPTDAKPIVTVNDYPYIEFPLGLRYEFNEARLQFFGDIGIAPHFIVKKYDNILPNNLKNNIAFNIALGFNYNIKNNISILLRPSFSIQLINTWGRKSSIQEHLYRYGIDIGFSKSI